MEFITGFRLLFYKSNRNQLSSLPSLSLGEHVTKDSEHDNISAQKSPPTSITFLRKKLPIFKPPFKKPRNSSALNVSGKEITESSVVPQIIRAGEAKQVKDKL